MTKAQRILKLYDQAIGTMPERKIPKFVAAEIGTSDSYVRTVARQRLGTSKSEAERRYLASPLGMKTRREISRRHRERNREHYNAYQREWKRRRRAEARAS